MTFVEIMDRWPSRNAFADDLGVNYQTMASWRRRDLVPPDYWLALMDAAAVRGIPDIDERRLLLALAAAKGRAA